MLEQKFTFTLNKSQLVGVSLKLQWREYMSFYNLKAEKFLKMRLDIRLPRYLAAICCTARQKTFGYSRDLG